MKEKTEFYKKRRRPGEGMHTFRRRMRRYEGVIKKGKTVEGLDLTRVQATETRLGYGGRRHMQTSGQQVPIYQQRTQRGGAAQGQRPVVRAARQQPPITPKEVAALPTARQAVSQPRQDLTGASQRPAAGVESGMPFGTYDDGQPNLTVGQLPRRLDQGGVVGPAHMAEGGRAVDFSGVGKQLEEMLEPVMMKFGGMSVDHNVNHQSMNVTGGDGIGSAIAESVAMKVGGMVEGMIDGALGQLEQRPDGGIYRNKMS